MVDKEEILSKVENVHILLKFEMELMKMYPDVVSRKNSINAEWINW